VASPLALIDGWQPPRAAAVLAGGEIVDDRGDTSAVVWWASVTKLATALATMRAVADGHLGLDDPAGPPGSTVRHLLAHASGLDRDRGRVQARPGTRRIYSNAAYEVLAATVAAAVGQPFDRWLSSAVFEPLGMTQTRLAGSPASGLVGPLADLVGLAGELQRPFLLPAGAAGQMHEVAFPGLAGVLPGFGYRNPNDWGLGPELRGTKEPHWTGRANDPATFGHFGAGGGFVWVDPVAGLACACLTANPFGPWAQAAWPALADAVLSDDGLRVAVSGPA
jgi:CubicO group peptidase (beta-lactamase class C family)